MPMPLNTKVPVKQYTFQVSFLLENGDYQQIQATSAQRSLIQDACDRIVNLTTIPSGQGVRQVIIDVGNGFDKPGK